MEEVRKKDLWKERHESFNEYLISLEEKHKKHRSQLHHYRNVAGLLEEYTTPKQLNAMGIAKASVLAKSVKQGSIPPADVIEAAQKTTNRVEDVRKLLFDSSPLNGQNAMPEKGNYRDLGGIYATNGEWEEITKAFALATRVDPVISESIALPVRMKEILLRMAQECISSWEPSLNAK